MKFNYRDTDLIFFPSPGIRLNEVKVYENFVVLKPLTGANAITFLISWKSLYRNRIILSGFHVEGIDISLIRNEINQYEISQETSLSGKTPAKGNLLKTFSGSLEWLQLENISLSNAFINYNDLKYKKQYRIYINEADISQGTSTFFTCSGYIDKPESIVNINAEFNFPSDYNFHDMFIDAKLKTNQFPASLAYDVLKYSNKTNYSNTFVSGNFKFFKEEKSDILDVELDSKIKGIVLKSGTAFTPMKFKSLIQFNNKKMTLALKDSILDWPPNGYYYGSGIIYLRQGLPMNLSIFSNYAVFLPAIDFIQIFRLDFNNESASAGTAATAESAVVANANTSMQFNLRLNNVYFYGNKFNLVSGQAVYRSPVMHFNNYKLHIYNGIINSVGSLDFRDFKFRFTSEVENIEIPLLVKNYTDREIISGKLNASVKSISSVTSEEAFFKELKSRGNFIITQGELKGYANVTKVIATVGKLLNVLGPPGKSTAFQSIKSDFTINHEIIRLLNLEMDGVGIDANAKGKIGMDSSINMRVTLSLAGPVGTVLKIPVIYSGKINQDEPYIDPVWVTSVAVGSTVAFPGNPVPGVMVGSFVSDYIRDFMDIFSNTKDGELDEIDSPIR